MTSGPQVGLGRLTGVENYQHSFAEVSPFWMKAFQSFGAFWGSSVLFTHAQWVNPINSLVSLWWLLLDFYFSLLLGHCEEGVDMSTPWEGILKIPYQSWVQRTGKFGFEMLKQPCHPRRQYSVTMCCVFELCCVRASEVWWRMLTYEF